MRILHISDTHGQHVQLDLAGLQLDVLVHSGDFCDKARTKKLGLIMRSSMG